MNIISTKIGRGVDKVARQGLKELNRLLNERGDVGDVYWTDEALFDRRELGND